MPKVPLNSGSGFAEGAALGAAEADATGLAGAVGSAVLLHPTSNSQQQVEVTARNIAPHLADLSPQVHFSHMLEMHLAAFAQLILAHAEYAEFLVATVGV
jgi:hypothetical protein